MPVVRLFQVRVIRLVIRAHLLLLTKKRLEFGVFMYSLIHSTLQPYICNLMVNPVSAVKGGRCRIQSKQL